MHAIQMKNEGKFEVNQITEANTDDSFIVACSTGTILYKKNLSDFKIHKICYISLKHQIIL